MSKPYRPPQEVEHFLSAAREMKDEQVKALIRAYREKRLGRQVRELTERHNFPPSLFLWFRDNNKLHRPSVMPYLDDSYTFFDAVLYAAWAASCRNDLPSNVYETLVAPWAEVMGRTLCPPSQQ